MSSNESLLYELWERHASTGASFRTLDGRRIVVLSRGQRNLSSGPDYLGAVLLIDGAVAVGPVEMHLLESDWFQHGHDGDAAYASVILHVLERGPVQQRLHLPTVTASAFASAAPAEPRTLDDIGAGVLAELAWERLLRRATEVLRAPGWEAGTDAARRAFVARLFDALGYSRNRVPMRAMASDLLDSEDALRGAGFDVVARLVFAVSGLPRERVAAAGSTFISASRLAQIVDAVQPNLRRQWDFTVRSGATPERRVWGAVKLLVDLYRLRLVHELMDRLAAGASVDQLAARLVVRMGTESYIGLDRSREIVINALIPVAIAAGAIGERPRLIAGACQAYRTASSLPSNQIIRNIERRYLSGDRLEGAFWQQGAIELHQRYLSADRSGLRFVAER